MMQQRCHK